MDSSKILFVEGPGSLIGKDMIQYLLGKDKNNKWDFLKIDNIEEIQNHIKCKKYKSIVFNPWDFEFSEESLSIVDLLNNEIPFFIIKTKKELIGNLLKCVSGYFISNVDRIYPYALMMC